MKGRRVYPDEHGHLKLAPGDYGKDTDGFWKACAPRLSSSSRRSALGTATCGAGYGKNVEQPRKEIGMTKDSMLTKLKNGLEGKKTYIVAAAVVLTALGAFLNGDLTLIQAVEQALVGMGIGTLRAGVAKS